MICERCHVVMKSGTSYENRKGRSSRRRFDECPMCHDKKYNNGTNFQEMIRKESNKTEVS